jgi:hypothetical protein
MAMLDVAKSGDSRGKCATCGVTVNYYINISGRHAWYHYSKSSENFKDKLQGQAKQK